MKFSFMRFLFLVFSIMVSSIINELFIDSLLEVFKIISFFALVANRIATALFIYFFLEMIFINKKNNGRETINKLFFIYFIWLIGMLFGRFSHMNSSIVNHFNFHSFIPNWLHHLDNSLVRYYIFGNILVFIPYGIFLRYYKNIFYSITYFILSICLFETIQAITHLGYFDIDDLILNGIGGLFGILVMDLYKTYFN